MMDLRIHTVGASGSGTTTLADALAAKLNIRQFDSDTYFWELSDPPFTTRRSPERRVELLSHDLALHASWVLSGSIVKWGEVLQDQFTHIVFITLPAEIRLDRIKRREYQKFGNRIEPGGDMYQQHIDFIDWAKRYDSGGLEVRSKILHEAWFKTLSCPIIRISGELSTNEQVESVSSALFE